MTTLILIAVVGVLGSYMLCWVTRTAVISDAGARRGFGVRPSLAEDVAADGWLAAMTARNEHGTLGGERRRTQGAHERLVKAERYSGGR